MIKSLTKNDGKYRQAVFVIVYKKEKGKIKYLILKRKLHWKGWEFTKGGIEKNETPMQTVIRELKEETNLSPKIIQKHNYEGKYNYNQTAKNNRKPYIGQSFTLFSAQVKTGKVKIDKKEHEKYEWLSYEKARERLTWVNQKNSIKIVNTLIKN